MTVEPHYACDLSAPQFGAVTSRSVHHGDSEFARVNDCRCFRCAEPVRDDYVF